MTNNRNDVILTILSASLLLDLLEPVVTLVILWSREEGKSSGGF